MDRCDIVRTDSDWLTFVDLLARTVLYRSWILHAWVLMTNHFHLVVTTPLANLSEGMHDLLSVYALRFNEAHDRVGHLFQHRFDAKPVERETHLLELTRYLPLNPVRAGLVQSPEEWQWSSFRATAGLEQTPEWLEVDWTLAQFHATDKTLAQKRFREFVAAARDVEYDPHANAIGGWILGSNSFCDRVQSWIDNHESSSEYPRRQRRVVVRTLQQLTDLVIAHLGVSESDLCRARLASPARMVIADLGREICAATYPQLAERLGMSDWGAAKLHARSRQRSTSDPEYREVLERIRLLLLD